MGTFSVFDFGEKNHWSYKLQKVFSYEDGKVPVGLTDSSFGL